MKKRYLALAILIALTGIAIARPGGGDSFSGGGGHSSGGGSGGGGAGAAFELIYWTIRLLVYYPQLAVPLLIFVVAWLIWNSWRNRQNKDWDSGPPVLQAPMTTPMTELMEIDPDFSQVAFEDFAYRLFATAQRARATAESLATVSPYVSQLARESLFERTPNEPVESVVVGAMRAFRCDVPHDGQGRAVIGLEFEANVTTAKHTYYSVENWILDRDVAAKSRPPGSNKTFPCPNCGAPWEGTNTGTAVCSSCKQVVDNGRFDWLVQQIVVTSSDERPPTVTANVPERGTDLQTYRQPGVDQNWAALREADPALTESNLFARLGMIYGQLNDAWSKNDLAPVRGCVSDGLYDYLQYWIDAYKVQGFRNDLVDMRITHSTIAKVLRDKYFTAITIRVWGTGKDFVTRIKTGGLVRGSKHRERKYSEYWTLIRAAGKTGEPKATATCPNCGAPLEKITQAGDCEHCGAHVTTGDFDWVLSKIEQDDTYRG